jgi:phosphatidylglycerophosphate synthase
VAFELDAIVLADDPLARVRIAGLPAHERARRSALRVGATRVLVIDAAREGLVAWRAGRDCPLLVIRADQLVHPPLVAPLVAAIPSDGVAVAVGPDGAYAGAYVAAGSAARNAIAALAQGENAAAFAGAADAARIPHGEIARHPIATAEDRAGARRLLYKLLIKPQDNAVTRYLFRPISLPLTKLLVKTPITPNQVSIFVGLLVVLGCWFTAHASVTMVIAGSLVVLASGYFDCCDGEIARLKLMSSKLGAWIDTIVDEFSTMGFMAALGWHCHLRYGEPGFDIWIALILLGVVTYGWSVYCIYFNIIVGVGSANSQDYVGRFVVVPGTRPDSVRLQPAAPTAIAPTKPLPPWLQFLARNLPYVVRRDFLVWAIALLAILHLTHVAFVGLAAGGPVIAAITTSHHLALRKLRRKVAESGRILEAPAR